MCSQPVEPNQRLFFAIWPDAAVRTAIDTVSRQLVRKRAKRVPASNLHITVAFPGSVTTAVRACLEAAAGEITFSPFELSIERIGYWPRPRVIWVAPAHTPPELWALATALRQALDACGLVPETRPYQPHITLARKAGQALPVTEIEPIPWSVREFALIESVTDPAGARYRLLRSWPPSGEL